MKRMTAVSEKLAALEKESDGEAAKYGQDIVLLAAFNNAKKYDIDRLGHKCCPNIRKPQIITFNVVLRAQ